MIEHVMLITPTFRRVILFDGTGVRLNVVEQERGNPDGPWAMPSIRTMALAYLKTPSTVIGEAATLAARIALRWVQD